MYCLEQRSTIIKASNLYIEERKSLTSSAQINVIIIEKKEQSFHILRSLKIRIVHLII